MKLRTRALAGLALFMWAPRALAGDAITLPDFNKLLREAGQPQTTVCSPADPSPSQAWDQTREGRWAQAGFGQPHIEVLQEKEIYGTPPPAKSFTHQMSLTAVILRNAQWTSEQVKSRLKRVAEVYGQCGIKLARATLVEVDAPGGDVDVVGPFTMRRGAAYDMAKATPKSDRPILYYVRSSRSGDSAFAVPEYWVGKESPLLDTAFITAEVNTAAYREQHDPSYSVDSHELGHVLGNCGHYSGPHDGVRKNFLAGDYGLVNDQIQPQQCEQMKKHPRVRPL